MKLSLDFDVALWPNETRECDLVVPLKPGTNSSPNAWLST